MKMFETQMGQMTTAINKLQQSGKFLNNAKVNPNEQCMVIGVRSAATSEGSHGSCEMGDESKQHHEKSRRVPPLYRPPGWMPFSQRHYKIINSLSGTTQEGPKMVKDESAPPVMEKEAEEVTIEVSGTKKDEKKKATSPANEMPQYAKFLKDLVSRKKKLGTGRKLPAKIKDLGSFNISCIIGGQHFEKALCDLGVSINLMPLSIFKRLSIGEMKPTSMVLQMADRSVTHPLGVVENMLVKVGDFIFPADFMVLDIEDDKKLPLILGRPFLAMGRALTDVEKGELTL
ncbi:uncharacterized protein LOC131025915 [Salvia miltiorrhiza]|uniref:uncharacterized protein LOC131025915 n=1 Tax=Salvia miltiorrhiza TaxID=226208 RepID=UPI0025AD5172|nr:uncharacterized protein LOC131025915 [Salvia miltiorrhiza]